MIGCRTAAQVPSMRSRAARERGSGPAGPLDRVARGLALSASGVSHRGPDGASAARVGRAPRPPRPSCGEASRSRGMARRAGSTGRGRAALPLAAPEPRGRRDRPFRPPEVVVPASCGGRRPEDRAAAPLDCSSSIVGRLEVVAPAVAPLAWHPRTRHPGVARSIPRSRLRTTLAYTQLGRRGHGETCSTARCFAALDDPLFAYVIVRNLLHA